MDKTIRDLTKLTKTSGFVSQLTEYPDTVVDQRTGKKSSVKRDIISMDDIFKHEGSGELLKRLLPLPKYQNIISELRRSAKSFTGIVNVVTGEENGMPQLVESILRVAFPPGTTYKAPSEKDYYHGGYEYSFSDWGDGAQQTFRNLVFGYRKAPSKEKIDALMTENMKGARRIMLNPSERVSEDSRIGMLLQRSCADLYASNPEQFAQDIESLNDQDLRRGYEVYKRELERLNRLEKEAFSRWMNMKGDNAPTPNDEASWLINRQFVDYQVELVEELGSRYSFRQDEYKPSDYRNRTGGFLQSENLFYKYQRYVKTILDKNKLREATKIVAGSLMSAQDQTDFDRNPETQERLMVRYARAVINDHIIPLLKIIATMDPNPVPGNENNCIKNIVGELIPLFNIINDRRATTDSFLGNNNQILVASGKLFERARSTPQVLILHHAEHNPSILSPFDAGHGSVGAEGTAGKQKEETSEFKYEFLPQDVLSTFSQYNRSQSSRGFSRAIVFVSPQKISFARSGIASQDVQYVELDAHPVDEKEAEELVKFIIDSNFKNRPTLIQEDMQKSGKLDDDDIVTYLGRSLLRKIKSFIIGQSVTVALKILENAVAECRRDISEVFDKELFYSACVKQSRRVANQIKGIKNAITTDPEDAVTLDPKSYIRDFSGGWGMEVEKIRGIIAKYIQSQAKADDLWDKYDEKERNYNQSKDTAAKDAIKQEMESLKSQAINLERVADSALETVPSLTILYGDPASGKSIFPEALANALGFNYMTLDFGQAQGGLVGQTEHRTEELLNTMKSMFSTIFLIDEMDGQAFGSGGRNPYDTSELGQVKRIQEFFSSNDKILQKRKVKCIGTTNNPEAMGVAMKSRASLKEVKFNMTPENIYEILTSSATHLRRHYTIPPADMKSWEDVEDFVKGLGEKTLRTVSAELSKKRMDFRQLIRWVCDAFSSHATYLEQQQINDVFSKDRTPNKSKFQDEYPVYYVMWLEQVQKGMITKEQPPYLPGAVQINSANIEMAAKRTSVEEKQAPAGSAGAQGRATSTKEFKNGFDIMAGEKYQEYISTAKKRGGGSEGPTQMELPLPGMTEPTEEDDEGDMVQPADTDVPPAIPPEPAGTQVVEQGIEPRDTTTPQTTPTAPDTPAVTETPTRRRSRTTSSTDYFYDTLIKSGIINNVKKEIVTKAIVTPVKPQVTPTTQNVNNSAKQQGVNTRDLVVTAPATVPVENKTTNVAETDDRFKEKIDLPGIAIVPAYKDV